MDSLRRLPHCDDDGSIFFKQRPLVAVQSADNQQRLLVCATCHHPLGPISIQLALNSGWVALPSLIHAATRGTILDNLIGVVPLPSTIPLPPIVTGESALRCMECYCSVHCSTRRGTHLLPLPDLSPAVGAAVRSLREVTDAAECNEALILACKVVLQAACAPDEQISPECQLLRQVASSVRGHRCLGDADGTVPGTWKDVPRKVGEEAQRGTGAIRAQAWHRIRSLLDALGMTPPSGCQEEVFVALEAAVEARSVAIQRQDMSSVLSAYCQSLCKAPVGTQEEALMAIGPALQQQWEEDEEEAAAAAAGGADALCGARIPLWSVRKAQQTKPLLLPKLLSDAEIAQVHAVAKALALPVDASGPWQTQYLQTGGGFRRLAPDLLQKLHDAACSADAKAWGLLRGRQARLRPRCVEYHTVLPGGALPDPTHHDRGSVLTIDVMLSDPREFAGGAFCTLEDRGVYATHAFGRGDALVFVSHKRHCVSAVTEGRRTVLVVEFWDGEERTCNHRCERAAGFCPGPSPEASPDSEPALSPSSLLQTIAQCSTSVFAGQAYQGRVVFGGASGVLGGVGSEVETDAALLPCKRRPVGERRTDHEERSVIEGPQRNNV